MRICQNARGFTLIETIISLAVLTVVVSLIPLWLNVMDHTEPKGGMDPMEVELFFRQAGLEIREAAQLKKVDGQLVIQKFNGNTAAYYLKNGVIRRQVNGRGDIWMLQHVKSVRFKIHGNVVVIFVTGEKGRAYERTFFPFAPNA
ncbi:MAG TPA: competence type IV pilus minor pilin ComGF [Bacillales bacterium]|nr:competence type IV pilus minor pilin ComGF [Bacillales bacterium]